MRRFLIGLLAGIGLLTLIVAGTIAVLAWRFMPGSVDLPQRIVLTTDWQGGLAEAAGAGDLLSFELRPPPAVTDVVLALDQAAADPRVAGLVVRLDDTRHGFAVAQELRDAVRRFRAAGKFAIAHADSFGELSSGNEGYYLATAFDEIHLQPVGLVGLTGLMAEVPLARELLASLGVELEVARRAEYKTALESFTENQLSPPNREALNAVLDVLQGQLVRGIAEGRKLEPAEVRRRIDEGPYTGDEALGFRLIDRIAHVDETLAAARARAGQGAGTVDLADYAEALPDEDEAAPRVAMIRAAGMIRRGEGGIGSEITAEDLAGTLAAAAEDDGIAAVLLRIDSGGGSAVASETIARGVRRVREAGKPVVVSMSNAAASGGYWIAMDATRIVAHPATLTGSIGVVAGKPMLSAAWDKLGVNWAAIARGENAEIWSVNRPYSPEGRARVEAIVDWLYASFTAGVARGRDLPPEKVDAIAKGRVWAGETARELGLVDQLGGLDAALLAVRRELGLPEDAVLSIERLPEPDDPLHALLRWLQPRAGVLAQAAAVIRRLDLLDLSGTAQSLPLSVR
jgi:protease-4